MREPQDTPASAIAAEEEEGDVHRLHIDGREIILVGTAHISQESVDLVRQVIEQEAPDCVCVELDERRYQALAQRKRWEATDLREVIRNRQLATLLINMVLSSYQKRMGLKLGVMPGSELLTATREAESRGIPVALCDRDVRVTLRRAWGALSLFKRAALLSSLFGTAFDAPELSEEELRRIRRGDVMTELMDELGRALPELKTVLIDERDSFLSEKIRRSEGRKVVAVVGAGHVAGMRRALMEGREVDLEAINEVPPASALWRLVGWGVSALILGSIAYIGYSKGPEAAGNNALYWILANGIPSAIGCGLALGHPLTVASAFAAAPFTSLTPVIGAGYVTAFVQTYLVPPRVGEFQTVSDQLPTPKAWWSNRLLRVFLVFLLTGLGSAIGTWGGGVEIGRNLL